MYPSLEVLIKIAPVIYNRAATAFRRGLGFDMEIGL
jgi:hypothetical protein